MKREVNKTKHETARMIKGVVSKVRKEHGKEAGDHVMEHFRKILTPKVKKCKVEVPIKE
jgi:hypothetical protein